MPGGNKNDGSAKQPINLLNVPQEEIQKTFESIPQREDITGVGKGSGHSAYLPDRYYKIGTENNWSPFTPPKNMEKEAYFNQSGWEVLKNSIIGFGEQAAAGVLKSMSSADMGGMYDMAVGNTEKKYGNWLNDLADKILEHNESNNPIFQSGSMWDTSYWANQFQSLGLSTGIILETLGEQALLAYMTGGTGNGVSLALKARLIRSFGENYVFGSFKGVQEAYINGLETQSMVYNKYRELGYDDATAQKKASEAATLAYRTEIIPLMLLNGLQYALTFGVGTKLVKNTKLNLGFSGAVETVMDRVLPNVTNKFTKGVIGTGANMLSESLEEGVQNVIQQYAVHKTINPKSDFNPLNQELVDNMVGGLFGGAVFQAGGKILKPYIQNTQAKQFDYLHNEFLKESPQRFANSYESKSKAEQNLRGAIINHDKVNSKESKLAVEKASFEYENAQRNSQAQSTLDALHLDYITGKETAFESHIEQMQNIYDAVSNNDTKALTQYGLLDEKGEERFKGSFDLVKNTFTKNIEDAKQIKSMLEDNIYNITSDFESAWAITQNQFNTKESLNALNETYNDAKSYLDNNIQYQQLSEDGKQRFNIENEIDVLESMGNLSERNQDRLISLKEDLSNLENTYTKSDKNLLDTINKESVLSSYMGAYLYNEQIDNNNKQLKDLVNKKKIQEKIEERKEKVRKKKATKATKEDKEDIKKSIAKEEGDLTDKDVASVETAAVENNVNPKGQLRAELESPLFNANEFNVPAFNEQSAEFNESLNLQPHVFESNNESHNKVVDKYVQAIDKLSSKAIENNLDVKAKELFNIIADHTGLDTAYKNFNLFKEAYKKSGLPYNEQELDEIYRDRFDLSNIFDIPTPITSVTPEQATSNKTINEEKQAMEIVSHKTLEEDGVVYTGPKVIEPVLKMAFKGVEYTEVFNPTTGKYERKDADTLLRDGLYDIDTIVNPNQLLIGENVEAIMDMNWISPKGYEKGSKEWLAEVPIIGIYKGKSIGPIVHSVSWWNTNNVGDFTYNPNLTEFERQEKQKEVIDKARQYHSNLRQSIYNNQGKGSLQISKKVLGFESNNYGELYNVNNTVPNATIGALKYDSKTAEPIIIIGNEKVFNGNILNSLDYIDSDGNKKAIGVGTTMLIKQVGMNENNQPTYVAYPVIDNNNQETLKELRKSRGKIYDAIDAITKNKQVGNISVEMANKILDEVSRITKVSKSKLLEVSDGKHIGMNNINYLYPENMREDRSKLRMGFSSKGVGKQVPIINENNSVTSKPYEEVLKEQLYTQHKFYEINTPQGKDYVLYPQPRIEFTSTEVNTKTTQEFIPNEDKTGIEVKDDVKPTEEVSKDVIESKPITEISNSQTSLVKQEFFNMALKDIYSHLIENPKSEVSNKDITKIVIDSFDKHLDNKVISIDKDGNKTLFKDVYKNEYEYLKSIRNSLLGLNENGSINTDYTSIIKSVGDFINQELADIVDIEGFNEKTTDRAAYEVNVKTTLGLKAKLLLAGRSVLPKNKRIKESFGGFQEYYKIDDIYDALQQILSNNDNDVFSAANKIDDWIKINEKEFGFLESVKDIFLKSDTPIDVKKQLLYRLNQTKNQMFFGLYSKTKNGWRLQSMNSNSREPSIVVQNYYNTNLKTNSPLVKYSKKGFKLNEGVAEKLLNQYNTWKNKNSLAEVTAVELGNWLSNFGIDADPVTLEKYKRANNSAFSPNSSLHGRLAENLKEFLKKQKDSTKGNPNFIFNTEDKNNMSFKGKSILQYETSKFLKDFIQLEIANTFHTLKSMYIAGKTINTYSQPNFASLQVDKLKDKFDNKGLRNELRQTPFSKNSLLLSLLENDRIREGLAISYVSLNPLKQRGQKIYNDDGITAMYAGDREASMLAHFMTSEAEYGEIGDVKYRGAKMSSAALSDSSQLFLLHLPVLNLTKSNFEFENGNIKLTEDLLNLLYTQLIKPDVDRIEAFLKANQTTNTIGKDFASQIITTFPELNTLEKGNSFLLEDIHKAINESKSVEEVISNYKTEIFDFIETYIKSGAESKFSYKDNIASGDWVKYEFIKSNGKEVNILDKDYLDKRNGSDVKENVIIASYDYFINYMVAQAQWQMLFAGDYTNYFKDADKVFEKSALTGLPKVFSIKNLQLKSNEKLSDKLKEQYIAFEKKAKVDLSKRLKEQISPGNRLADSSNKKEGGTEYLQLMISDVELPSNTLSHIVNLWYKPSKEDLENIDNLQSLLTKLAKAEYDNNESEVSRLEKEVDSIKKDLQSKFPDVADYMNITGTDAQEYTTWREHLNILYNQGNITKEDYDNIKKKLKSQSKDGINETNKLTTDEKKVVFQPIKPLHTGMYFSDVNGFKDQRFVYVKTSSFPLLPETTLNSELDGVRKNMERLERTLEKPVRASYQTGNKVGAIKNTIGFNRLSNPDININELTSSSMILDRANFSIQQDKPFKTDKNIKNNKRDEVNRGTQFEDIILGNGINHIKDTIFPNLFDDKLISDLDIEVKDGNISGIDLYRIYNHIYEQEQDLLKKQLYNSLGLDSNGEWEDSIQSIEAIRDLLIKQLNNQQDKEILDLVYVVPTKDANGKLYNRYLSKEEVNSEGARPTRADFKLPLWITPNSQKFESVLNSAVGNKLIKLKMPGFSSPVASEQGFKYLEEKDYKKGGIIYTNAYDPKKGLQATYIEDKDGNKVLHKAQVLVSSKFRGADGKLFKIPTTKDGLVDLEKIDKDLLSMFSFRIPTSAHQSGAIIEIVGFLPHEQGDLMIVPKDHTIQIGEDYDIDTRYVYGFNTYQEEDGSIRKIKWSDMPNSKSENLDQLYKDYVNFKNELKEEFFSKKYEVWYNNREKIIQLAFAKDELETLNKVGDNVNKVMDNIFRVNSEEEKVQLQNEIDYLQSEIVPIKSVKEEQDKLNKELDSLLQDLLYAFRNEKNEAYSKYRNYSQISKMKLLVLENNITNLFKSIYSTTNPDIQKSISATLSTKFAKDTASLIDDKISTGANYSIYDDRHQSRVMMLGASGKMGIGVHSNWVVLNSLFQQVPISDKPQLIKGYDNKTGEPIPFTMTFGNFKTNGILGLTDKNELDKIGPSSISITTANMINQNSATDNQKLQIMGRRNENKYTINVFALMTNLGIIDDKLSNGKTVGYPDLFISQPIIRRYAELKAKYDSITSEYNPDVEREIKDTLIKEFGNNVKWAVNKDEDGNETEVIGYMDREKYNSVSNSLNAQTLYDNLVQGDGAYLNENQWAVYEKFMELDKQGREVSKLQQLLNIEGQGLGVSYFDVIVKKDNIMSEFMIHNATKMLGNFATAKDSQEKSDLESKGYVTLTNEFTQDENGVRTLVSIMVQPTTPQNRKLINSTANAYNLWKNIFPFENTAISEQIDRIFNISEINTNTKKGQELRYDTLKGIQDYFYSYKSPINSIFENDINSEREKLFMNTNGNVPLANYLFLLKNKKHPIFQESFFRDLKFNTGYEGEESIIEYNLSEKSNFNKNEAYKILEELSNDNRPIEDGKTYTYSDLVKDLTKYSMLSNQENGAIGFRQYIPTSVLEKYGVIDGLRTVTNIGAVESHSKILNGLFLNLKKDLVSLEENKFTLLLSDKYKFDSNVAQINSKYGENTVRVKYTEQSDKTVTGIIELKDSMDNMNKSVFIKQFIQHNPKYAKTINLKEEKKDWSIKDNTMISKTGYEKDFIKVRDSESSSWMLFEHIGEGVYNRIETLGTFGVNEYSPFEHNKTSLFEDNKFGNDKKIVSQAIPPAVKSNNNISAKEQIANQSLSELIESISNKDSKFSDIAKLILTFVGDKKVNIINLSEVKAKGAYIEDVNNTGGQISHPKLGLLNKGEIYLDESLINSGKSEEIRYALIEETLHSITSEEVSKYIDSSKTAFDINGTLSVSWRGNYNESNAPLYITRLLSIYQQAGNHIINELKSGVLTKGQQVEQLNNSATFENKINRILNLKEFIIGVTTDESFREEMSKVKYNGKSVLSKFAQVIKDILNKLLKNQGVNNSITENGFNAVMDMLEYRSKDNIPSLKEDNTVPTLIEKAQKLNEESQTKEIWTHVPEYDSLINNNTRGYEKTKIRINSDKTRYYVFVMAKTVNIKNFENYTFKVYKDSRNNYNIVEASTGMPIVNNLSEKSITKVISNTEEFLSTKKEQFEKFISEAPKLEGNQIPSNNIENNGTPEVNLQPNVKISQIIDILLSNNLLTKTNC